MDGAAGKRTFYVALTISALLHLSMVTVFSIVIWFPREVIDYYAFDIVEVPAPEAVFFEPAPGAADRLRSPNLEGGLGELADPRLAYGAALPPIQLPTLEFAELRRLRVRTEGLDALALYGGLLDGGPRDSWGRFGEGLARVRQSITDLALPGELGTGGDRLSRAPARPVHRPAEGFEAYIEWNTEPKERALLFAPPIRALWDIDPRELGRTIEVVIEVTPQGRVINAYSLQLDDTGILDEVQAAVLRYNFEPLPAERAQNQLATVHIAPARGRS